MGTSDAPVSCEVLVEAVAANSIGVPQVMDYEVRSWIQFPGFVRSEALHLGRLDAA